MSLFQNQKWRRFPKFGVAEIVFNVARNHFKEWCDNFKQA
jgi:hypothetical protein